MELFGFLFWLFLAGILAASFQDLKRTEVDDWLSLFLLFSSISFILVKSIISSDSRLIFSFAFLLFLSSLISHLFYFGRVFAGGDAKLLFSLTAIFVGVGFYESLFNYGAFIVLLFFSGAIYGLLYISFLYFRDFKKVNKLFKKRFLENYGVILLFSCLIVFFMGLFINFLFIVGIYLVFFLFLFHLSKIIEEVSFSKTVLGRDLREGDWLSRDLKIGNKILSYSFGGLSKEDIKLIGKKRKVEIKNGIPFVPAFLIAYVLYFLLKYYL